MIGVCDPAAQGQHGVHTRGMRFARDEDRDRTRIVVWSNGSESDLEGLIVAVVATCVCIVGVVVAFQYAGGVRILGIVMAVIGAFYALMNLVPLVLGFAFLWWFDRFIERHK